MTTPKKQASQYSDGRWVYPKIKDKDLFRAVTYVGWLLKNTRFGYWTALAKAEKKYGVNYDELVKVFHERAAAGARFKNAVKRGEA